MTRRRSSAPGRSRPARRRSLPWLLLPALAVFLAAGCIGQDEVRDEASPTPTATATPAVPSAQPSAEPSPTAETTPAATPAPTEAATPAPTVATSAAPPTGQAGSADACSGTDDNRAFFAGAAEAFAGPVYCAVLPSGWFVVDGEYRRSTRGGWLFIIYRGPGGARFELHEGAFCNDADGCVPDGPDVGSAAFGDRSGTLVDAGNGRYAIVVDRGDNPSWLAMGDGLNVEQFRHFAASLVRVEE